MRMRRWEQGRAQRARGVDGSHSYLVEVLDYRAIYQSIYLIFRLKQAERPQAPTLGIFTKLYL